LIEVVGLVKHHGSLRVLDELSLSVQRGEVAAILGPSGSGKSTLLRCLNGLESFDEGSVRIGEQTLTADKVRGSGSELRRLRQRVGMVFQQFHLFPHMTVLENVLSGPMYAQGRSSAEAEPEARQLLDRVGLGDRLHSRPDQLSGGQQQRVAIARALAVHPEVMLFDEPTSALDPRMAGEVLAVMADLARSGQTMLVVTHALTFARKVAHTVHVIHAGKVAESGPAEQVFNAARHEVTRAFLAEVE
jgi:polar amino acid transport system ATP-binding protein